MLGISSPAPVRLEEVKAPVAPELTLPLAAADRPLWWFEKIVAEYFPSLPGVLANSEIDQLYDGLLSRPRRNINCDASPDRGWRHLHVSDAPTDTSGRPGNCPICGMTLEPVKATDRNRHACGPRCLSAVVHYRFGAGPPDAGQDHGGRLRPWRAWRPPERCLLALSVQ